MKKNEKGQKHYQKLHELSRRARTLSGISQLLEWDQETYMPAKAAEIRALQLSDLAGIVHSKKTCKKYAKALERLIDLNTGDVRAAGLSPEQQAAVKLWRRDYKIDTALPRAFVEDFARKTSEAQQVWRKARKENDFEAFAPYLEKIIELNRKKAEYLKYEDSPYDALLDLYEPGFKSSEVTALFTHLQKGIIDLLKKIQKAKPVGDSFLHGKFPHDKQMNFGHFLLKEIGFDFDKGRLDISTHPFSSSSHPNDSRVTTRIHLKGLFDNISSVLHEGGHSLYEMGLPANHYGSPLGEAISMGFHESQSRWWETRIGHSKPFWQHYLPFLKKEFQKSLSHVDLESFYKAINKVQPSFIRVEADEVTYNLHVILRYELELALIEGTLKVRDLPEAWNEKMKKFLGITPKSNAEGCMQDIHWSMGAFGYFPTYTLGNLYASHLFEKFEKDEPEWGKKIAAGKSMEFIKNWLQENIYCHGRRFASKELLKIITSKDFSSEAFLFYLNGKYGEIYV